MLGEFEKCVDFQPTFGAANTCQYIIEQREGKACGLCKKQDRYRCLFDSRPIPLSHSSVQDFLSCHRLYYLKHVVGIEIRPSQKSDMLKAGTLFDAVTRIRHGQDPKVVNIPGTIEKEEIPDRVVGIIKSINRAMRDLDIKFPDGEVQHEFWKVLPIQDLDGKKYATGLPAEVEVHGFLDVKQDGGFIEYKCTGSPDRYHDARFLASQAAPYFMSDETLDWMDVRAVRYPALRKGKGVDEENDESFADRVYEDIIRRPSWYFPGWNKETRSFGKRFYRSEFDLEEYSGRFRHILREIHEARLMNGFYRNDRACNNLLPGIPCEFQNPCWYNKISETIYQIREKKIEVADGDWGE